MIRIHFRLEVFQVLNSMANFGNRVVRSLSLDGEKAVVAEFLEGTKQCGKIGRAPT
jgi:hypothetical protein